MIILTNIQRLSKKNSFCNLHYKRRTLYIFLIWLILAFPNTPKSSLNDHFFPQHPEIETVMHDWKWHAKWWCNQDLIENRNYCRFFRLAAAVESPVFGLRTKVIQTCCIKYTCFVNFLNSVNSFEVEAELNELNYELLVLHVQRKDFQWVETSKWNILIIYI